MLLSDIKKLAKKRAKNKKTTGSSNKNVYGGVGMIGIPNDSNKNTTDATPDGGGGGGDGGGDGGGE